MGIQLWEEQHSCNEICKAFEDAQLFEVPHSLDTGDENASGFQEPPRKKRKIQSSSNYEDEEIVILDVPAKGYSGSSGNPANNAAMRRPTPPNFNDDEGLPDPKTLFTGRSSTALAPELSDDDGVPLSGGASEAD